MSDAVQLIANALKTGLTHPGTGDGPVPLSLPMFQNSHIPGEMRDRFAEEAGLPHADVAKLTAEALVHLLETNGDAVAASMTNRAKATAPAARPKLKAKPKTDAKTTKTGPLVVTVDGETIMTELGDWKQHPPEMISAALKPNAQPPAWKKALLMTIVDITAGRKPTWSMNVTPERIDITTDGDADAA